MFTILMRRLEMKQDGFIVPVREKIAYGMGDLGINIAWGAFGFYFVFFLTDVAGIPAYWAGVLVLFSKIWDAVTDLFMGVLSDRTRTRFGRKRTYLLIGAVPFGLSFACIWVVPFREPAHLILYYAAVILIYNAMFTVVAVPYNAMLPELTQNYDERTDISGYKLGLSFVGTLVGAAGVMLIVDLLYAGRSMYQASFPVMGKVLALLIIFTVLIAFKGSKERVTPSNAEIKKLSFISNFKSVLSCW